MISREVFIVGKIYLAQTTHVGHRLGPTGDTEGIDDRFC